MTALVQDLNISKSEYKQKLNQHPTRSIEEILQSSTDAKKRTGFILWPNLMQELRENFCGGLTEVQAAVQIRWLVNQGKLFEVPYWMTAEVAFTRDGSILESKVKATDEDDELIHEQQQQYIKEVSQGSEHAERREVRKRRQRK
jgi:hypothetical protein